MKRNLQEILSNHNVKAISFDSRNIKPGDAFFAITGGNFNGNDYIDEAFSKGASIVFTDNVSLERDRVIYIQDIRKALSVAAGIIYPKIPKNMIGVTGTNGKSSVVSYIHQILTLLGKNSASMGTIGIESSIDLPEDLKCNKESGLTTSDPINFRKKLHNLTEIGIDNVAFEVSSHGLDQSRLGDIKVNSAAFISFSQDHLEYHKTMESYLRAKLILFSENLLEGGEAVINSEIMFFDLIRKFLSERQIAFSTVGLNGDLKIKKCEQSIAGQRIICEFMNHEYEFYTKIIGSFQAINLLVAAKLVFNLGIDFKNIIEVLPELTAVSGRLQRITPSSSEYHVFVDYAHTPDALEKSLSELNSIKRESGKLYVVFGCGGDRDNLKRPIMGKIASSGADYVIITDDNPRTEDASKIRSEIAEGAVNAEEIADRKSAIESAIARLGKNDILLVAGKGHEDYQIIGQETIRFSDVEVVREAII